MARKSRKNIQTEEFPRIWKTAIYARLSRENDENESIETQIEEVKSYTKASPCLNLIEVYQDNGFSGSNFKRPAFERLMEDLRNQKIDCIVVKDLSRFAREHIDIENYLCNIFPFLGIRFIAIRDNYDNINMKPQEYFIASFKNFANAYFAKETSRKVIDSKRNLMEQGKYIGSRPPFGYMKDPNDKHKLIIEPKTAPIVLEIFQRSASGESHTSICNDLNKREIKTVQGANWTRSRLHNLLTKEAYIGTLVQHTYERALYKEVENRKVPKEEQIRMENAFPAIIEREIWDKVQSAIKSKTPPKYDDKPENIYKSYVFCGHCGYRVSCRLERRRNPNFYVFDCTRCRGKQKVYATDSILNSTVRNELKLSQDVNITRKIITGNFEKIIVFDKNNISFKFFVGMGDAK